MPRPSQGQPGSGWEWNNIQANNERVGIEKEEGGQLQVLLVVRHEPMRCSVS